MVPLARHGRAHAPRPAHHVALRPRAVAEPLAQARLGHGVLACPRSLARRHGVVVVPTRLAELGEHLRTQQLYKSPSLSDVQSPSLLQYHVKHPVSPLGALSTGNIVAETRGVVMSTVV